MGWQRKSPPQPFGKFGGRRHCLLRGQSKALPPPDVGVQVQAQARRAVSHLLCICENYTPQVGNCQPPIWGGIFGGRAGRAGLSHMNFGELDRMLMRKP